MVVIRLTKKLDYRLTVVTGYSHRRMSKYLESENCIDYAKAKFSNAPHPSALTFN